MVDFKILRDNRAKERINKDLEKMGAMKRYDFGNSVRLILNDMILDLLRHIRREDVGHVKIGNIVSECTEKIEKLFFE